MHLQLLWCSNGGSHLYLSDTKTNYCDRTILIHILKDAPDYQSRDTFRHKRKLLEYIFEYSKVKTIIYIQLIKQWKCCVYVKHKIRMCGQDKECILYLRTHIIVIFGCRTLNVLFLSCFKTSLYADTEGVILIQNKY